MRVLPADPAADAAGIVKPVVATADTLDESAGDAPRGFWSKVARTVLVITLVLFAIFWVWALFFAPKEAVNKIDDRAWAARAEAICADVRPLLFELDQQESGDLEVRADLVVESTDLLSQMLDDVTAVTPSDEKGQAIIPDWVADYRQLLEDRYRYADRLRSGENVPFTETAVRGVPITERIETFAADNEMSSCRPPRGGVL